MKKFAALGLLVLSQFAHAGADFQTICDRLGGSVHNNVKVKDFAAITSGIYEDGNVKSTRVIATVNIRLESGDVNAYTIRRGSVSLYDLTKAAYLTAPTTNICVKSQDDIPGSDTLMGLALVDAN